MRIEAVGLNELQKALQNIPERLFDNVKKQFNSSGLDIHNRITLPMQSGANGLQSRSGNLARSITHDITGTTLKTLSMSVNTNSIYAMIHEKGGTIKGKDKFLFLGRGPLLSIPTQANKTGSGVTRYTPTAIFAAGGYIGQAYVFVPGSGMQSRTAMILNGEAMYTFASKVTIKPTLKMVSSAYDEVPTLLSNLDKTLLDRM